MVSWQRSEDLVVGKLWVCSGGSKQIEPIDAFVPSVAIEIGSKSIVSGRIRGKDSEEISNLGEMIWQTYVIDVGDCG